MTERDVPLRELRNDISRVLDEVEAGAWLTITRSGRPVAELGPVSTRRAFVPWSEVEDLIRAAPLDKGFIEEIRSGTLAQTIDEL